MSIFNKLWDFLRSLTSSPTVHMVLVTADSLTNELKDLEQSDIGQFLENTVKTIIPGSTGLIYAFDSWLAKTVTVLNWAVEEEGKTDKQKVADAVTYLKQLKIVDIDAYSAQLNSLNALIQKWMSDNQGAGLTMPQALVAAQVIHNPDLLHDV